MNKKLEMLRENLFDIIKITVSLFILLVAWIFIKNNTAKTVLCIISGIISGYEIFINSCKGVIHGEVFGENTLMMIASITAYVLGEYYEGVLIILLFSLGELLEDLATDNSRKNVAGLSELRVKSVNILIDGKTVSVEPEKVIIGSLIQVKKGERVPIDGEIYSGIGEFDCKAITGESRAVVLSISDKVYSGSINIGETIIIKTVKLYSDSTVEQIIKMVEGANSQKSKSQKFITAFSKFYTPIIVCFAILFAVIPPIFNGEWEIYIYKSLSFLIVSCPCALVISVPLAFFVGIGSFAKKGILIKGSGYIDIASKINSVAFDKTGTLTMGEMEVVNIKNYNVVSEQYLFDCICSLESLSNHPISKAIIGFIKKYSIKNVTNFTEKVGKGLVGIIDGKKIVIGSIYLMKDEDIMCDKTDGDFTKIYISINNTVVGEINLTDKIRDSATNIVSELKSCRIEDVYMISGDSENVCKNVGNKLGIKKVFYEFMPHDKLDKINEIKKQGKLMYVGDGINDTPSLTASDIGVAMGGLGSQIAVENSSIVILDDDLRKIPYLIKKSRKIKRKVISNIFLSLSVKFTVVILSLFTTVPVWLSLFSDVGIMLLAVFNSLSLSNL